jgi:hypothetical protein
VADNICQALHYGEHGRELITVDVAVQLLRDLARGVEHAAALGTAVADIALHLPDFARRVIG